MNAPLSPELSSTPGRAGLRASLLFVVGSVALAGAGWMGLATAASGFAAVEVGQQDRNTNWPQWRGPLGTGVAPLSDGPVRFDAHRGIKWQAPIPGRGMSSPIVWDELVFVTTAVPTEAELAPSERPRRRRPLLVPQEFRLIALDRGTGAVRWSRTAITARPHEGYHRTLSSYANASPVTDGRLVYAFFGSRGLYAYDLGGNAVWSRDFGVEMETYGHFGEASGPALHGDTLVVLFDHEGQSFIEAVDAGDGHTIWKQLRDEDTSWTSPYVVEHEGVTQVVASGGDRIIAYDLSSGEVVWKAAGMTPHPIPTPVAGDGLLFAVSGSRERRVRAIRLGRRGDLTGTDAIVWALDRAAPYSPSPLLWDDELYLVRDTGLSPGASRLSLFDARTGKPQYLEEIVGGSHTIKASPVGAGDKVYLLSEEGDVVVLRRGPGHEVLAVNPMEEPFIASPAVAGGELYMRGLEHLFCISSEPPRDPPTRIPR